MVCAVTLGALSLSLGSCATKQQGPATVAKGPINSFRPYSIEHAIIHMEYFSGARGSEDMFIDSFGRLEAHDVHSELMSESNGFKSIVNYTVKHGSEAITIDSVDRKEIHLKDPSIDSIFHLPEQNVPSSEEVCANYLGKVGFKKTGTQVLSGLTVNVWQMKTEPLTLFEWHSIIVARQTGVEGRGNELRLISVDTVTPIDPSRFQVQHTFPLYNLSGQRLGEAPSSAPPPSAVPSTKSFPGF